MTTNLTVGLDAGSSAIKVVVTRSVAGDQGEILASGIHRIRRRDVRDVAKAAFEEVCAAAKVDPASLDYVATTGDSDAVTFGTGHFYGMTTHARGAAFLVPTARAALDVGALHARALKMDERGKVLGHRMTSQCASGTGQFVENIARYLGVPLEDVGALSLTSTCGEEVSSVCAVLAETDVINMVSRGVTPPDILKGIHLSIAGRLARLLRSAGAEGTVALTGGLARDIGLLEALRALVGAPSTKPGKRVGDAPLLVEAHELGPLAGAIGAGLLGAFRFEQLKKKGRTLGRVDAPL